MRVLAAGAVLLLEACRTSSALPPISGPVASGEPLVVKLPRWPSGEPFDLAKNKGRVVLLDVWATWCEPCREALPVLEALGKEYGGRGLDVITINTDANAKQITAFLSALKVAVAVLIDRDGAVSEKNLHVKVMPTTFLIDRQGQVRMVHEGFNEASLQQYQTEIEGLLAESAK